MKEEWKDINDFDGYQISNLGNVKSLSKEIKTIWGFRMSREIILTSNVGYGGYRFQSIKKKYSPYIG